MTVSAEAVTLANGQIATYFRGGAGPTLLWLHAANGVTGADPVINALSEHFDVVAPVAPGFVDLKELDEIRDVRDLALWYDDFCAALDLDSVLVAGHSFGGMVAAELAAHYPSRVRKLVLIAAVGLWNPDHPMVDLFAIPATEINDYIWGDPSSEIAQMAAAAQIDMGNVDAEHEAEVIEVLVTLVRGMTAVAKFLWPLPDKGLSRRLYRVTCPTLILWGAKDRLTPPEGADDFAALIKNSEVRLLEDAGHMVTIERLADVVGELKAFAA